MSRTIVIGDIHGGLKALIQLLERIDLSPSDRLIFLGDYVDGWSDSANTVTYLIELAKQNTCIFIRGNHDDLTENWLKTGDLNEQWLQHGGQSTIEGYRNLSSVEIKEHLNFYSQMLNYYIDQNNKLFVHAGFTDLSGPVKEYHPKKLFWDRTLWEMTLALDKKLSKDHVYYPKRLLLFNEIYIGHTPVTRIGKDQPVNVANVWNVDTGAAFKGKISAIEVTTKEIWQSDPVYELYQGEEGRN
jgi:serine/threonine protein phosphatase 1